MFVLNSKRTRTPILPPTGSSRVDVTQGISNRGGGQMYNLLLDNFDVTPVFPLYALDICFVHKDLNSFSVIYLQEINVNNAFLTSGTWYLY